MGPWIDQPPGTLRLRRRNPVLPCASSSQVTLQLQLRTNNANRALCGGWVERSSTPRSSTEASDRPKLPCALQSKLAQVDADLAGPIAPVEQRATHFGATVAVLPFHLEGLGQVGHRVEGQARAECRKWPVLSPELQNSLPRPHPTIPRAGRKCRACRPSSLRRSAAGTAPPLRWTTSLRRNRSR